MKKSYASLRFLAMFFVTILVFGLGGSVILAAFDKEATGSKAPLFDLATIFSGTVHFIQTLFLVAFTGTNHFNQPYWTFFLMGLATTVQFCFIAMPLALIGGFLIALMSGAKSPLIRLPARAFVEFIRNTPLLVQMLIIYNGLPFLPHWLNNFFTAGIATLIINYCAYEAENLRAGLVAVDRGQTEAAVTLGLSRWETLRLILIPQMIPISLPTVINDFIYMFKDSSILSVISVGELTLQTNQLQRHFPLYTWQFFTIGALLYLALSLPLGRLARALEARLRSHAFAPGRNLTTLTGQTLGAAVVLGWIAGALAVGISVGALVAGVGQILAALLLTVSLLIGVMLILGSPTYGIAALIRPLRRGRQPNASLPTDNPLGVAGSRK